MNNPYVGSECGNHILPDNFMITGIFIASVCPLADW